MNRDHKFDDLAVCVVVVSHSFGPYQNLEAELIQSVDELIVFEKYLYRLYADLPVAQLWMKASHHMFDLTGALTQSFVNRDHKFDDLAAFVVMVSHSFGHYQYLRNRTHPERR